MKVKCFIAKYVEKEIEIDDKFKILDRADFWNYNISDCLYDECIKEVESKTGVKMEDCDNGEVLLNIRSVSSGNIMIEL